MEIREESMASIKSKITAHMKAAFAYAELSRGKRLKVGAVLIKDDRIISLGYNGMPTGSKDNSLEYFDGSEELVTKDEVVHAEKNCIAFAAKNGISTDKAELVITCSPCHNCATLLIQSGIKRVWYIDAYRDPRGIKLLREYRIIVNKVKGA